MPSAENDWQGMVGPEPAFYLKVSSERKKV